VSVNESAALQRRFLFWRLASPPCLRRNAVANGSVTVHPFAIGNAAATAVGIDPSVVSLVFGLTGLAIDLDVIHLHISTTNMYATVMLLLAVVVAVKFCMLSASRLRHCCC
jgi:hypothetical protein